MFPPLQRYYGTLRLPAVHLDPFDFFTSRYHRVARGLLPSVVGVPPGARELSVPVSPSGLTMETSGSLRFLGNPGGHCPCSSTPVGSGRLSGPRVSCLTRPPAVSTTKAPSVLYFRGSITRPLTSLSTLRRMGRPTTTQDSLLAAGPALPGGILTRRVSAKGFRVRVSSSFPKLTLRKDTIHNSEKIKYGVPGTANPCPREDDICLSQVTQLSYEVPSAIR